MSSIFDELREELVRERLHGRSESCLPDETLQAIADGSASTPVIERARRHFDGCISCLQAYATFRSLLEAPITDERATGQVEGGAGGSAEGRRWKWGRSRGHLQFTIPIGWSTAATVAAALLTWMLSGRIPPRGDFARYEAARSDKLTELSHKEGNRPVTIAGTVESLQPAGAESIDAYVVTLRTATGVEYTIFAWGRPTVREGQTVEADGVFMSMSDSGGPGKFQGVASKLRPITSK